MQKQLYRGISGIVLVLLVGVVAFAGAQEEAPSTSGEESSQYVVYDEAAFEAAADQTRVYFFHAGWCPTCRSLDRDITRNLDRIPAEVVLFKTDYDSSTALKRRYGVTYQHTLVVVDAEGELVSKWTGGDFDNILEQLAEI
jgi:thioredoxin